MKKKDEIIGWDMRETIEITNPNMSEKEIEYYKLKETVCCANGEEAKDTIKENLIKDLYNNSVELYYILADNNMRSCGHPGIQGQAGGESRLWDVNKAMLEGAVLTLQVCLNRYKEVL